ncbi:MAG: polysaccharide biosynthesis protein [Lachnospiraceae bacterium]|nr:polysaccharide biosynthesis protein [Lachnospiraceae bacterium]
MKIPRNSIIYGTFILTAVSFLCRAIGFFYRIYISQTFGEEGMGIFQLTAPVMSVAYSLCCAGFQTAISRYVAARTDDSRTCVKFLLTGLSITGMLSVFFSLLIYECSNFLATNIILEPRTAPLLRLLALSFPFSSVHCCLNGYYYGKKKAGIPALLQLTEQITRVGGVYLLCQFYFKKQTLPPLAVSAAGTAIAEFGSAILSLCFILPYFTNKQSKSAKSVFQKARTLSYRKTASLLLTMAVPLSISRIIVNLLQSVENIYIPEMLRLYGYTTEESLALFGVLTGMALTVILLPCSFVNSMAVLLLPKISEAQSRNRNKEISLVIKRCIIFCCILGSICTAVFFFGGCLAGNLLFHSKTAGEYIVSLSFICPFLYITASLGSVLHGLGKTYTTLFINIGTLLIRIASVFFLVSRIGIPGYILGLLAGQCFSSICCIISLRKYALY